MESKHPGKVSIRDVARAAGVSTATVSQAFNPDGRIAQKTRRHVREVAERLGYEPNPVGRALRSGRSHVISVVPSFRDPEVDAESYLPCFRNIVAGVVGASAENGYAVTTGIPSAGGRVTAPLRPDGIIVVDPMANDPIVERALETGIPVVTIGGGPSQKDQKLRSIRIHIADVTGNYLDTVLRDSEEAGAPFRPAIFVGGRIDALTSEALTAFQRWCERHKLTPHGGALQPEESLAAAARRLLSSAELPSVFHCSNEAFSSAILREARARGLSVPDDLRVGVMGNPSAVNAPHGVDYFAVDPGANGVQAARALVDLIDGREVDDVDIDVRGVFYGAEDIAGEAGLAFRPR